MKGNLLSLTELAQEIEHIEQRKADYVTSTDKLVMIDNNQMKLEGVNYFDVTQHAHGQIANRLGIPKTYYDKIGKIPQLRAINVNALMHEEPEPRMVRTLDGNIRAFLSDKFRPYDNYAMLSSTLPVIKEFQPQIKSQSLTPTRMYIQMIFPATGIEIGNLLDYKYGDHIGEVKAYSKEAGDLLNETLCYGVTLRNSEVGAGKWSVEETIWSVWCKNLAIGESIIGKYHVGRRLEEGDYSMYSSKTIKADIEAFRLQFRDVITHALKDAAIKASLTKYAANITQTEVVDPIETVQNVTKRFGLNDHEMKDLTEHFLGDGRPRNQFGMGNALTAMARDLDDPDKAYDLERRGYEVITLKPGQWKEIAA